MLLIVLVVLAATGLAVGLYFTLSGRGPQAHPTSPEQFRQIMLRWMARSSKLG